MGTDKRARQKAGRQARLAAEKQAQQRDSRRRLVVGFVGIVVAVGVVVALISLTSKKSKTSTTAGQPSTTQAAAATTAPPSTVPLYGTAPCPATDGSSKRTLTFSSQPKNCLTAGKSYTATMATTAGTVVMKVDTSRAPAAANSFVFLSRYHYYDATKLFRVNTGIDIIQGGSPHTQSNSDPGPGYTLADEPTFTTDPSTGQTKGPYTYQAGDVALANTGQPNSSGAQFFFITGPGGAGLDSQGTYMIIGHVTSGLPILQKIVSTSKATSAGGGEASPNPPVTITSVKITES